MENQTVVVTGASAGIGRATARLFGERGDRVGLISRGQAGLDAAAREVEEAGGKALAVSADVADYEQVAAAAGQIEQRLGPIDIWVNVAFTSLWRPRPAVFLAGAGIDACHAVSMVALAAWDPRMRRAGIADAVAAAAFTATGALTGAGAAASVAVASARPPG